MVSMRAFLAGLSASLSIAAGYFPIALSFGLTAVAAGLPPVTAMLISVAVYAGASQFILVALLTSQAGPWAAVLTVVVMNARHVFYGPTLAQHLPPGNRLTPLMAFGLTDEVFASAMSRIGHIEPARREGWYLGLMTGAYASWLAGTALGVSLSGRLETWPGYVREALAFVLPALFLALLLEVGVTRHLIPIAAAALAVVVLSSLLPAHYVLVLAIAAGAAAHALAKRRSDAEGTA